MVRRHFGWAAPASVPPAVILILDACFLSSCQEETSVAGSMRTRIKEANQRSIADGSLTARCSRPLYNPQPERPQEQILLLKHEHHAGQPLGTLAPTCWLPRIDQTRFEHSADHKDAVAVIPSFEMIPKVSCENSRAVWDDRILDGYRSFSSPPCPCHRQKTYLHQA